MRHLSILLVGAVALAGCSARGFCEAADCDEGAAGPATTSATTSTGSTSSTSTGPGPGAGGGATTGTGGGGGASATLEVTPGDALVGVLRPLTFAANEPVAWSVAEPDGGTIDPDGNYVSPEAPGVFHVVATSMADAALRVEVEVTVAPLGLEVAGGIPGGAGNVDGPPARARFDGPRGFALLPGGDELVADTGNHTLRIHRQADDEVTTFAGQPGQPGNVSGLGTAARFDHPSLLVTDAAGARAFVVDGEGAAGPTCIRAVVLATAQVTTLAGACGVAGVANGATGAQSRFSGIEAMVLTSRGLLVCQRAEGDTVLRLIDVTTGATTTRSAENFNRGGRCHLAHDAVAGVTYVNAGGDRRVVGAFDVTDTLPLIEDVADIPGDDDEIDGLAFSQGHLYLLDRERPGSGQPYSTTLYDADLADATPVFDAIVGGEADYVDGALADARLMTPGFLVPGGGRLHLGDLEGHTVRRVDYAGFDGVETILGARSTVYSVDGPKDVARLLGPSSVALGDDGDRFVAGAYFGRAIRRIDASGAISLFSGVPERYVMGSEPPFDPPLDGPADEAVFGLLWDVVRVGDALYVADGAHAVRSVAVATGAVDTVAGVFDDPGADDGLGTQARFDFSTGAGLATDGTDLFVADAGNFAIRKIDLATGDVTTLAGGSQGTADGVGSAAQFGSPSGLAYDGGFLYVADAGAHTIRRVDVATAEVTTWAGRAGTPGDVDGGPDAARFSAPRRLVADGIGNLYVTSTGVSDVPHEIRRIRVADAVTSTFAGDDVFYGFTAGPLPATLGCPFGLVVDPAGDLLFADACDGAVGVIRAL